MAEAFARMHGQGEVEVYSAGSQPSGTISQKAIAAMKERGYDPSRHTSKSLDQVPTGRYDVVVTMGCGDACPHIPALHREDWAIPDPRDMGPEEYRKICDTIENNVINLLVRMEGTLH